MAKETILFACEVTVGTLKQLVDSTSPFCKSFTLELGDESIHYHGIDDGAIASVVGKVVDESVRILSGQTGGVRIGLETKALAHRLAGWDAKTVVVLTVAMSGKATTLRLEEGETVRMVTVQQTDAEATVPALEQTGDAAVDVKRFSKVVASLQPYTDAITLELGHGAINATYATSRSKDGWKHPADVSGSGKALYSSDMLSKVCKGAAKVTFPKERRFHLLSVGDNTPLRLHVEGDKLAVEYYLASRELMT